MRRSIYPYDPADPDLRTCRHGTPHRVHVNSLCIWHPRTCLTCCSSVEGRDCAIRVVDDEVVDVGAWRRFGAAAIDAAKALQAAGAAAKGAVAKAADIASEIDSLYGTEEDRR